MKTLKNFLKSTALGAFSMMLLSPAHTASAANFSGFVEYGPEWKLEWAAVSDDTTIETDELTALTLTNYEPDWDAERWTWDIFQQYPSLFQFNAVINEDSTQWQDDFYFSFSPPSPLY